MISIVIPTYNEAENITKLIPMIHKVLKNVGYQVIISDDNSPDGTGRIADELSKRYPIKVIHRMEDRGFGKSIKDGFRLAMKNSEYIISMDCDLSHDPIKIKEMLKKAKQGYDVVIGSRYVKEGKIGNWPLHRRMMSKGANLFTKFLLGMPVNDCTAGFRCYKRGVLEAIDINSIKTDGYSLLEEIMYRIHKKGFRIAEIPITFIDRRRGESKLSKREIYKFLFTLTKLKIKDNPGIFLILLLAFALRFFGIFQGLPFMPHTDEPSLIIRALKFGTGDFNPHFFDWPGSLLMYILFFFYGVYYLLGLVLGFFSSPEELVHLYLDNPTSLLVIGRSVSVIFGVGTVYLLYLIGSKMFNKKIGLFSSLFLAVNTLHIKHSQYALSDIPMTFFVVMSFFFCYKILQRPILKYYILGGITAGLAISSKYPGGMAVLSIFVAHILSKRKASLKTIFIDRNIYLAAIAAIAGFFIGAPFAFISIGEFINDAGILLVSSVGKETSIWYGYSHLLTKSLPDALGGIFYLLVTFGMIVVIREKKRENLLLLALPIAYLLFFGRGELQYLRYILPAVPFFMIVAGKSMEYITSLDIKADRKLRILYKSILIVVFIAIPIAQAVIHDLYIVRKPTSIITKQWVEENIPIGSKIAVELWRPPLAESKESLLAKEYLTEQREPEAIAVYRNILENKPYQEKTYYLIEVWAEWERSDGFRISSLKDVNPYSSVIKRGAEYIIVDKETWQDRTGKQLELYKDLENKGGIIFEINETHERPGTAYKIYKLANSVK